MHELAVMESVADVCLNTMRQRQATRVLDVWMQAGEMRNLEQRWVQLYFDDFTKGTGAQGACVHVERIPVTFRCATCGCEFVFDHEMWHRGAISCPACGAENYEMTRGNELSITGLNLAWD